jgi:hypothetical protein
VLLPRGWRFRISAGLVRRACFGFEPLLLRAGFGPLLGWLRNVAVSAVPAFRVRCAGWMDFFCHHLLAFTPACPRCACGWVPSQVSPVRGFQVPFTVHMPRMPPLAMLPFPIWTCWNGMLDRLPLRVLLGSFLHCAPFVHSLLSFLFLPVTTLFSPTLRLSFSSSAFANQHGLDHRSLYHLTGRPSAAFSPAASCADGSVFGFSVHCCSGRTFAHLFRFCDPARTLPADHLPGVAPLFRRLLHHVTVLSVPNTGWFVDSASRSPVFGFTLDRRALLLYRATGSALQDLYAATGFNV